MATRKEDLLGATSPAIVVDSDNAEPFNPQEVLLVIRYNEAYSMVPCYCRCCGKTLYVPQEEAETVMKINGRAFPEKYELGLYIDAFGCPLCTGKRGTNPVVKTFEVKN
jgi:hypothetical protein